MAHPSSVADVLASCDPIPLRMDATLARDPAVIFLATQWRCLANSYSKVLEFLHRLVHQHVSVDIPSSSLLTTLQFLHKTMLEGERRLVDSIYVPSDPAFDHSAWLLNQALKLGASTDVVDLHLSSFMWAFSFVLESLLNFVGQIDNLEAGLFDLTTVLSNVWAYDHRGRDDDFSSAHKLLTTIKCKVAGVHTSCLANSILQKLFCVNWKAAAGSQTSSLASFIVEKLSHVHEMESAARDVLPAHLWIDHHSLQRNPNQILGEGGYGKVYEAEWLGGRFAVKDFFYVENNADFEKEAVIQARLRHPNVIPLVCCTKNPPRRTASLVMELMQQDLRMWMLQRMEAGKSPPFSLSVAVGLMLQIAQGMEYLHSLHIMHRDLKSSNVLVSFSNNSCNSDEDIVLAFAHLKIADFGMSKTKHASSRYTTKLVGTTVWRAPEVFDMNPEDEVEGGMNAKYTKKADVYSFGLVCYEILTGKFPFEGTQVRKKVLAGERPTLPTDCPQALSSYIESCWNGEPSKRPPFSQICRVLRYVKAAVLFQVDHFNGSQTHSSWLSQPLSPSLCASIDHRVCSFVQTGNAHFRPQVLNVPLEMHCCRVVLQQQNGESEIVKLVHEGEPGLQVSYDTYITWRIAMKHFSKMLKRGESIAVKHFLMMLKRGESTAVKYRRWLPREGNKTKRAMKKG